MAITALPTAPQRTDSPDVFATRADAWVASLDLFTTEANALQTDVNAKQILAAQSVTDAADQVTLAEAQVALATTQANNASISAVSAAASASTALNAPGTSGTSTTFLSIGIGSKTLIIQTGKYLVSGMIVLVYNSSSSWFHGDITSYNSGTGELIVNASTIFGSGTYSSWTVSLSAPIPEVPSNTSILFFNSNFI